MAKQTILEQMSKQGSILRGDDRRLNLTRLRTGVTPLDDILGGGLPRGAVTLIVGPESTGKTILCQYAIAAQQAAKSGKNVLYIDAERSFDPDWWKDTGVNLKTLLVARPATGEQLIDLIVEAIESDAELGMIVIDSLAAMPPSKIVAESAERTDVGSLAKLANLMFIKVMPILGDRILLITNQLRENIGGYGDRYPGGLSQRFYAHVILRTRRNGWIEDKGQRTGFTMEVTTVKNKTAPPQEMASLPFLFRGQLDMLSVAIDDAVARGMITAKPPYYSIQGVDEKFLGKARLREYLTEHPDVLKGLA